MTAASSGCSGAWKSLEPLILTCRRAGSMVITLCNIWEGISKTHLMVSQEGIVYKEGTCEFIFRIRDHWIMDCV